MSCIHCDHCRQAERNKQANADLHPLGTHLTHPAHGHVVYWRADIDLDGTPRRGHYVYRAEDPQHDLFYIGNSDFTLATVEIDLPGSFAWWAATDAKADPHGWWANRPELAEARRNGRTIKHGRSASWRITVTYDLLVELRSLAYYVRDMALATTAQRRGACKVIERINAEIA